MIHLSSLKDRPITSQSRGYNGLVLLLVYCLWSIIVLLYSTLLTFLLFCYHLANEEEAGCFTCIVFVAMWLLLIFASSSWCRGWSAVVDCGISWVYVHVLSFGLESHKHGKKPSKLVSREIG